MKKNAKRKISQVLQRSVLWWFLLPLILIQVGLVSFYFGINAYMTARDEQNLLILASQNLYEIMQREVGIINEKLKNVSRLALLMQRDHEEFFAHPQVLDLPNGEPVFAVHPEGAFYKKRDNGGAFLYYSGTTRIGEKEIRKARNSERLDPLLRAIVEINPLIEQAYLNTADHMVRIYPFSLDILKEFPSGLDITQFNFYYEGDQRHNPERKPVWIGSYLEPLQERWVISSIVPIYHQGVLMGISGLDIPVDIFEQQLLKLSLPWFSMTLLADRKGNVVIISDAARVFLKGSKGNTNLETPKVDAVTEASMALNILNIPNKELRWKMRKVFAMTRNIESVEVGGRKYFLSQEIVEETGWRVITFVDQKSLLAEYMETRETASFWGYLLLGFLGIFNVFLLLYYLCGSSRVGMKIGKSIEKVAAKIALLEKGGILAPPEETGIVEVDGLNENLKELAKKISKYSKMFPLTQRREHMKQNKVERLKNLANTDTLTQIANRYKLDKVLLKKIETSTKQEETFGIVLVDLDDFKKVNDTYGHQEGDRVLMTLADILVFSLRHADVVGRWGGEEFLVISSEATESGIIALGEKLRQAVETHDFALEKPQTASFGVTLGYPGESLETLIARADKALYRAKKCGKNRVEFEGRS